ncbi:hypothetical protein [Sphingomonas sp. CROZ-RG-20F-R02-07]|uniref:hypothetical protein n=1 Tax=Sphingomonas sp. CROZ-RG-20F-R02-07 TaxID=2914832 RepID=UPI001F593B02|nr:hypothetical protein [Sphingomonas sp. CROZ-RG-20F-R02-07]
MTDHRPDTDADRLLHGNGDGTVGHHSGEEDDRQTHETPRYVEVGVSRANRQADPATPNALPGEDIPSDAGRRAYVDEKTGEVRGSGAGAGGGTGTEDYDHDSSGGGNDDPAAQ